MEQKKAFGFLFIESNIYSEMFVTATKLHCTFTKQWLDR